MSRILKDKNRTFPEQGEILSRGNTIFGKGGTLRGPQTGEHRWNMKGRGGAGRGEMRQDRRGRGRQKGSQRLAQEFVLQASEAKCVQ